MKLRPMHKATLLRHIAQNGTNAERLAEIAAKLVDKPMVGMDSKVTVIVSGGRVGWAKRTTYAGRADRPNRHTGLSIAASRL
uniref:Uncharacterized protein n=1 Tax=viral metagenome TaxID=1070528 RepID=A0A6M3K7E9_9ZZZZ